MTDFTDRAFEDRKMIVDQLIADIEGDKGRVAIENDDFKKFYLDGEWRKLGYTKRELEERMNRGRGEVMGMEASLRHLYQAADQLAGMTDGSLPNNIELRRADLVVVYRSSEWMLYDATPPEDRGGWPWMANREKMEVLLVLWDPDTFSFCVVVDD